MADMARAMVPTKVVREKAHMLIVNVKIRK